MEYQEVNDSAVLLQRIEELEARVAHLTEAAPAGAPPPAEDATVETTTSRRGLLKLAGATAVGAAATSLLAAAPAAATDGGNLVIGADQAAEAQTSMRYDGSTGIGDNNMLTIYDDTSTIGTYTSYFPSAVSGWAAGGPAGVLNGAYGFSSKSDGYGTIGYGDGDATTHGVYALSSAGYGLVAQGPRAPLVLLPAGTAGAPTTGLHQLGEIYVDSAGILYRCVSAGTPGTWARLNSVIPLASPARVVDTRSGTGGITGPLTASTTATTSNLNGGSSGIPAAAIALVGTVTMVASTSGGNLPGAGFLTAFPGGTTAPTTSNVNADTGHAIASGLTVALGSAANAGKLAFNASFACHALLDVAAYII